MEACKTLLLDNSWNIDGAHDILKFIITSLETSLASNDKKKLYNLLDERIICNFFLISFKWDLPEKCNWLMFQVSRSSCLFLISKSHVSPQPPVVEPTLIFVGEVTDLPGNNFVNNMYYLLYMEYWCLWGSRVGWWSCGWQPQPGGRPPTLDTKQMQNTQKRIRLIIIHFKILIKLPWSGYCRLNLGKCKLR